MTMKRRDFLKGAASAPVAASVFASTAVSAQSAADGLAPAAFRFANDKVPMNAANLCPMPTSISEAIGRFQTELDIDMSGPNRGRIEEYKDQARRGIARQLGVDAAEIAIVRNTSEANNIVVQGIDVEHAIASWSGNRSSW